jgi:transcription initiation factor IIE alpha subunit
MKNSKVVTGVLTLAFVVLTLSSCKDNKKEHTHDDGTIHTEMEHSETAMIYACPMKCEGDKTYDKIGSCPTCKMDLKEVKDKNESKEMAMTYACPMKCEGDKTYDKMGNCPTCGMDLKAVKDKIEEDHSGHNH